MLELLDHMKLSQYREAFAKECITGEILAECDELILERELCITNRLHLLRIMKIIGGQVSVNSIHS